MNGLLIYLLAITKQVTGQSSLTSLQLDLKQIGFQAQCVDQVSKICALFECKRSSDVNYISTFSSFTMDPIRRNQLKRLKHFHFMETSFQYHHIIVKTFD